MQQIKETATRLLFLIFHMPHSLRGRHETAPLIDFRWHFLEAVPNLFSARGSACNIYDVASFWPLAIFRGRDYDFSAIHSLVLVYIFYKKRKKQIQKGKTQTEAI